MSGTPTEAEIQTVGTNLFDILEQFRIRADGWAAAGGELDVLEQSLEGEYLPSLSSVTAAFRTGLSDLVSQAQALAFIEPLIDEYARFISTNQGSGTGSLAGTDNTAAKFRAIYDHMVANSLTVESRNIAHDTSATAGGSNVGTGAMHRVVVDENAFELEACAVEKKLFRCVQDQNTGVKEEAEVFSVEGEAPSRDGLGVNKAGVAGQLGSGSLGTMVSLHAGSTSQLQNGSFSSYTLGSTPAFPQWDLSTGTVPTQTVVAGETYRSFPGDSLNAGMKMSANAKMVQTLANTRLSGTFDPATPYFCRLMYKIFSSCDGALTLRVGGVSEAVADLTGVGTDWVELKIGTTTPKDVWSKNFIQDGFDIEIELSSNTTGYVVIDDAIFAPYTLIDGTWWALRQTHATAPLPWLLDDTLEFTETGGAPGTAEIQYWLYRSGLGYLPHTTGTPTWPEPT